MNAATASLAYFHGLETIIIVGVAGLFACMVFAFILAFILRSFLHRGQQATTPEIKRRERSI